MKELILNKIREVWTDNSEVEFNIRIDEVEALEDHELFELFVQILTNSLTSQNERYKEELKRLYGIERPFICSWTGEKGADGMYDYLVASPAYGADVFVMFKRFKELK
jgi:hypothetical protein